MRAAPGWRRRSLAALLLLCVGLPVGFPVGLPVGLEAKTPGPAVATPPVDLSGTARGPGAASPCRIVRPSSPLVLRISASAVNRIRLPFAEPRITTSSPGDIELDGRVMFVTAAAEGQPISLFVSPLGNPELAIGLVLDPQLVAPLDVCLDLDGEPASPVPVSAGLARQVEDGHPLFELLTRILRQVALGQVPAGYGLRATRADDRLPSCTQGELRFDFAGGQVLTGGRLEVLVGTASNRMGYAVEIDEPSCAGDPGVAAVAAFPHTLVPAGGRTEVYVVRRLAVPGPSRTERARLVDLTREGTR